MRMKRLSGVMAPALLAALALAGTGVPAAQAEAVKLKAASFLPERVIFARHFYEWTAKVNEECAGEVELSVVGPAAVPSLEQWRALKTGVIDMHFGPPNYYKGEAIEADVSILAKNGAAEQKENGAWAMLNQLHNDKLNAWYLTHIHDGVNFFLYTNKPHQDGRFEGMRIRSVPIYDGFFRYLGADPVRMAPPDVGTALERGAVDGYGWPLWGVVDFGWHKFTKYRHGPGFFSANVNLLVNLDRWNGLADSRARMPRSDDRLAERRVAEVARGGGRQPGEDARGRRRRVRGPRGGVGGQGGVPLLGVARGGEPRVHREDPASARVGTAGRRHYRVSGRPGAEPRTSDGGVGRSESRGMQPPPPAR